METSNSRQIPKWADDLTHAFREIAVLLVALAPLDGALNKEAFTSPQVLKFFGVGCIAYLLALSFELLYGWILRRFSLGV